MNRVNMWYDSGAGNMNRVYIQYDNSKGTGNMSRVNSLAGKVGFYP